MQLSERDKQVFSFSGGIELDLGSELPNKYLNVAIPTRGGETANDQWVLTRVVQWEGETFMHPVDTARVIGNVIRTSSPPCPGVTGSAVYGFLHSNTQIGVLYGQGYDARLLTEATMVLNSEAWLLPYKLFQPDLASEIMDSALAITRAFCIPIPSGRATVNLNTVTVKVRKSELRSTDSELIVTNASPNLGAGGMTWHFSKSQFDFVIDSPTALVGTVSDPYLVQTVDANQVATTMDASAYKILASATPGSVLVRIPIAALPASAVSVTIETQQNLASFPVSGLPVLFQVSGGVADAISVEAVNSGNGQTRPVSRDAILVKSSYGPGSLLLQVVPGTIDPTNAQIAVYNAAHPEHQLTGPGVVKVEVFEGTTLKGTIDPVANPNDVVDGGLTYTFDGDPGAPHSVLVHYDDGKEVEVPIPVLTLRVRTLPINPALPPREIVAPLPPRNQPVPVAPLVEGDLTLSVSPPIHLNFLDPATDLLTFTFSRPMDFTTLNSVHIDVFDSLGNRVEGELRVSAGNTKVTFVPKDSLNLGTAYTINLSGLRDLNGNLLPVEHYAVTVIAPSKAFTITQGEIPARTLEPLIDLALAGNNPAGGNVVIGVADLPSGPGYKMMAFSPKVGEYKEIGNAAGGGYRKRVHVVEQVSIPLRGEPPCSGPQITGSAAAGYTFTGNIAVGVSSAWNMSFATFYDITDPVHICVLGGKLLSTDPSNVNDFTRNGTLHSYSQAFGVTTVKTPGALTAYVALDTVGVMALDIGNNIPEFLPAERKLEPVYPGSYRDIVNVADRLVLANYYDQQLEVIDPNFAPVATVALASRPRRLAYAGAVARDRNQNGRSSDPGEQMDLLFVGEEGRVEVVDVSDATSLSSQGSLTVPGNAYSLDVDWPNSRLYVATNRDTVTLYNIDSLWTASFFDGQNKKLWKTSYPADTTVNAVKTDPTTGQYYVGTNKGLEIWTLGPPNLTGQATYTYYGLNPGSGLDFDHPEQRPIRGAPVELIEDALPNNVVASTTTDEIGRFVFFNAPQGRDLRIRVSAALGTTTNNRVRVIDKQSCGAAAASSCPTIKKTSAQPFVVPVGRGLFVNMSTSQRVAPPAGFASFAAMTSDQRSTNAVSYNVQDASPFAIVDSIYHAEETIKRRVNPTLAFPPLLVSFNTQNAGSDTTYDSVAGVLKIAGNLAVDSDEYDRVIVLHEWMHYFFSAFMRRDSVGGDHGASDHLDPTVAFGEGFASAFAHIISGTAWYVDTGTYGYHGGVAGCSADGTGNVATNSCSNVERDQAPRADSGLFCETCVIELVWDLYDGIDAGAPVTGTALDPDTDLFMAGGAKSDTVKIDFKKLYDAAVMARRYGYFNTVAGYLNNVRSLLPAGAAEDEGIRLLAKAEGVNGVAADTFDLSGDRLYNELVIGEKLSLFNIQAHAGETLSTLNENGTHNKLHNVVYFRFTVPPGGEGVHSVTIKPEDTTIFSSNWIMGCDLIMDGSHLFKNFAFGSYPEDSTGVLFPSGNLKFTTPYLPAGDVVFRVFTALGASYGPEPFSVLVER